MVLNRPFSGFPEESSKAFCTSRRGIDPRINSGQTQLVADTGTCRKFAHLFWQFSFKLLFQFPLLVGVVYFLKWKILDKVWRKAAQVREFEASVNRHAWMLSMFEKLKFLRYIFRSYGTQSSLFKIISLSKSLIFPCSSTENWYLLTFTRCVLTVLKRYSRIGAWESEILV